MICPRCLENNPESYRFCGMCGSVLAAVKPAAEPEPARASEKRTPPPVAPPAAKPRPGERVLPGSGPSLLGLNQPSGNQPDTDSLYDTAFSSMESYFEPGKRKPAWRRILVTLVIVAALGGVAWWGYGSLGWWRGGSKPGSTQATNPGAATVGHPQADSETKHTAAAPVAPSQQPSEAATPGGEESSNPPANAGTSAAVPAVAKPAEKAAPPRQAAAAARKSTTPPKRSVTHKSTTGAKTDAVAAAPTGADALFRKGEAYLYGRGVPKNCDQATKYLKLAAAESSAKARSALGTMYATGHCVPRDLPTSYRWFAQALRVDPNNRVLEKDLSGVWNQMTPPERQLATRLRQ